MSRAWLQSTTTSDYETVEDVLKDRNDGNSEGKDVVEWRIEQMGNGSVEAVTQTNRRLEEPDH